MSTTAPPATGHSTATQRVTAPVGTLGGPAAWTGDSLNASGEWLREWPEQVLDTFDHAVKTATRRGTHWSDASRETFDLSPVADHIAALGDYLEHGPGLVKLTGLELDRYTPDEARLLFHGLGHWLGRPVYQNAHGELLGEIRDEGPDVGKTRGEMVDAAGQPFRSSRARAQSNALLRWHTDRTDVVGLLCAGVPASGGISRVASAVRVHDEMVRREPALARLLYDDLVRSHLGEEAGGASKTYAIPVWGVRDGCFATHYSRTFVEAAQELPGVERLTDAHWAALDLLAELAETHCHEMTFEPGDMQFINNHVVYHARGAFEDDPASGRQRLLYRVWLNMANARPLPESYAVLFGSAEAGAVRGGIRQADGSRVPA